jgi:hypothetical protein
VTAFDNQQSSLAEVKALAIYLRRAIVVITKREPPQQNNGQQHAIEEVAVVCFPDLRTEVRFLLFY